MNTAQHTHSGTFGERLRRARLMRGLSLRELAARLESAGTPLSHAAVQKYEKGKMLPDSTILLSIARVFSLEPGYFFRPSGVSLQRIEFRKHANFPKKEANRVQEEAADYFEKYLQVEQILAVKTPALHRYGLCKEKDAGDAAEHAAMELRRAWGLGEAPLTNVHELLEEHGVKVKEVDADRKFDGFSGWADDHTPVIVLARWLNADLPRKRLTALHELGHLVLSLPERASPKEQEDLCYRFAAAMLLPASVARERLGTPRPDGISPPERIGIKQDWGISIAALMRRAADLGIISASRLKQFYWVNRKNRKAEPGQWIGIETADRYEQLVYRAIAQELITRSKGAELLGVQLDEVDHRFAGGGA